MNIICNLLFYTIGPKSVRFNEEDGTESTRIDNNLEINANQERNDTGITKDVNITITMDTSHTSEGNF